MAPPRLPRNRGVTLPLPVPRHPVARRTPRRAVTTRDTVNPRLNSGALLHHPDPDITAVLRLGATEVTAVHLLKRIEVSVCAVRELLMRCRHYECHQDGLGRIALSPRWSSRHHPRSLALGWELLFLLVSNSDMVLVWL